MRTRSCWWTSTCPSWAPSPNASTESDAQIRAEYAHVPDEEFRQGRQRVLSGFLARPRLYNTEYFHSMFEAQARKNLQRAMARLAN